ncbi:MAG: hypothetical protein ACRD5M_15355 [Candidatus Acidiferrales bacterium]
MLFAVAALFVQFSPAALTGAVAIGAQPLPPTAEANSSASTMAPDRNASFSREPESSSSPKYRFDKVSLQIGTKENSTGKLTDVSLESAADSQTLSTIRVPEIQPGKPQEVAMAERHHYTRSWLALSVIQHGAATFDAYSTRQAVSRGAVEDDPMMKPFAHSGAIYAAIQAGPIALDFIARRMQHSEIGFVRRMWWVPQSVSTATYIFAGVHNLNVAARQ